MFVMNAHVRKGLFQFVHNPNAFHSQLVLILSSLLLTLPLGSRLSGTPVLMQVL